LRVKVPSAHPKTFSIFDFGLTKASIDPVLREKSKLEVQKSKIKNPPGAVA
jgi:hypothetical protein